MQALRLVNTNDISRVEWLEQRKKGIAGSDIGAIAGFNKWKSPVDVYLEKTGQAPEQEDNDAMYFGRLFEDLIAKEFSKRTGMKTRRINAILQHPEVTWALANIDRLIKDKERGDGILEVKTASEYVKKEWEGEDIPASYLIQIQWYFFVTGLKWGYFSTLIGGNKFIIKYIERDDELIDYLFDTAKNFWENHVLANIPPMMDGSEASTNLLTKLYPESEKSAINLPLEADTLIKDYEEAKEEEKQIKERVATLENRLKAMMKENEIGMASNHQVTWKTVTSNRIDSKRLKTEQPEIYEKYIKSSSSRRFSVNVMK